MTFNAAFMLPKSANQIPFVNLCAAVYDLEAILRRWGIKIPSGSPLEEAALGLEELRAVFEGKAKHDRMLDHRARWRRALSLGDLALRLVEVRDHPNFAQLAGHLQLLVGTNDAAQYAATPRENTDNDKIFELWAAAALLRLTTDCQVDDPVYAKGDNPDFIGTWRGRRWGFAFKAPHSDHPETLIKNIRKGVQQIRDSEADCGVVILNGKNFFPHDDAWPISRDLLGHVIYGVAPDLVALQQEIHGLSRYHIGRICYHASGGDFYALEQATQEDLDRGKDVFWSSLNCAKPEPLVLTVWPAVMGMIVPATGQEALSTLKAITGFEGPGLSPEAPELSRAFSLALHGRDPFGPEPSLGD